MANQTRFIRRNSYSKKRDIWEIAEKKAIEDAKRVIRGDHTAGHLASQWLLTLSTQNGNPDSIYHKKGKRAYEFYCNKLQKEVTRLALEKGFSITTDIPTWESASH